MAGDGLTDAQYDDLVDDITSAIEAGFRGADSSDPRDRSRRRQRDTEEDLYESERRRRRRQSDAVGGNSEAARMFEDFFQQLRNIPGMSHLQVLEREITGFADDDFIRRMQELQNQFGGLAGKAGETFRTGQSLAHKYRDSYIDFQEQLAGVSETGNDSVRGLGVSLRALVGDARETQLAFEAMTEGSRGSADGFRFAQVASGDLMREMAVFGERMDLNRGQITTFLSREIDLGRESGEMLRNSAVFAKRAANITGDSAKEILNTIEALIKDTERYGNVSEDEMAQIGASLRVLGLDYQELNGMVDKFFSFDSAAQSVSALTTVFGVHIDAMEAMRLANSPDRMDFLNYIRDQFLATGKAAEDMTLAEQRLVQQQLGLSSVSAVSRLFDPTADLSTLDDLSAQTAIGAGEFEEAIQELESEVRQFGSGTADTLDQLADASHRALIVGLQRDILGVVTQIEEFRGLVDPTAQGMGNVARRQSGVGNAFSHTNAELARFSRQQEELREVMIQGGRDMNEAIDETLEESSDAYLRGFPARDTSGRTVGEVMRTDLTDNMESAQAAIEQSIISLDGSFKTAFDGIDAMNTHSREVLEQTTGALGIRFEDLADERKRELLTQLDITETVLQGIFNDDLTNTSERRLSRNIQRTLREAQELADQAGGQELFEGRLEYLSREHGVNQAALRLSMEDEHGDVEQGGSDLLFRTLLEKSNQSSARAPAQPQAPAESAQASATLEANSAELAAIATRIEEGQNNPQPIEITVDLAAAPVIVNLDGRAIAQSTINLVSGPSPISAGAGGDAVTLQTRQLNART